MNEDIRRASHRFHHAAEQLRFTPLDIHGQPQPLSNLVAREDACPNCGERNIDRLVCRDDDDTIRCISCQAIF